MNPQSKETDFQIKKEKADDYEPVTSLQGSAIDEQCLPFSNLGSSTCKIKVEADYDDVETSRNFSTQCTFERLKTECCQDEEDGILNKAISMNEAVGNQQHYYTKNLKMDHLSYIIYKCQHCRKSYSGRVISKDSCKPLGYMCENCCISKISSTNSDSLSEGTYDSESPHVASKLVISTITEKHNAVKNICPLKELRQVYVDCKTSTTEGMAYESQIESSSTDVHQKDDTDEEQYHKEMLQSSDKHLSSLNRHMTTHRDEKRYKCDVCQYASRKLANLKTHLKTHSGEKPYKCEMCQYASIQLGNLKRHRRTHKDEKPYKCEICQYAFRKLFNLQLHLRTHSGEKPFKCEICQHQCSQLGNLKRHMRTHRARLVWDMSL